MAGASKGRPVSELALLDRARTTPIPSGGGSEYVCPMCEQSIPTRKQIRLAKPKKYETVLNDVFKCPFDNFIFSPKEEAVVVRE